MVETAVMLPKMTIIEAEMPTIMVENAEMVSVKNCCLFLAWNAALCAHIDGRQAVVA